MPRPWIAVSALVVVALGLAAAAALSLTTDDLDSAGPVTTPSAVTVAERDGDDGPDPTTTLVAPVTVTVDQVPGDPATGGPSALTTAEDPSWPAPLVDPSEIRSGGPPPDGIPPIDQPAFEIADTVTWLADDEPVLLLEIDGESRAYPVQVMIWHEIVNDTFGDTPVTVTYCPLCNSAIAYVRRVGDRTFDFGTSGLLHNSSLVMYDRQTESLWTHFDGRAVIGALAGTELDHLAVATVSWSTFRDANPDGLVLGRDTTNPRAYGRNPYPGYDDGTSAPFLFDGETDDRLPAKTRVVSLRGETESIAVPLDELRSLGSLTLTLDGDPVVLLHQPGTVSALDAADIDDGRDIGAVAVYRASADGAPLDLEAVGDGTYTDPASGITVDLLGRRIDDPTAPALEPVPHLDTFWFAIAAFEPDTTIAGT